MVVTQLNGQQFTDWKAVFSLNMNPMVRLLYVLPASDGKLQAFLPQVDGWRGTKAGMRWAEVPAGTALYLVAS